MQITLREELRMRKVVKAKLCVVSNDQGDETIGLSPCSFQSLLIVLLRPAA
jgi:hypothetical protein